MRASRRAFVCVRVRGIELGKGRGVRHCTQHPMGRLSLRLVAVLMQHRGDEGLVGDAFVRGFRFEVNEVTLG